jgi:aquaporin Z
MRKYITEFIGTFFLVGTVGFAVIGGAGDLAPLAIGSILMTMIFAGAHLSGAHYNPAVTLAVLLRGRMKLPEAVGYWIVQIIAAVAASLVVNYMLPDKVTASPAGLPDVSRAIIAEFIGTFALAYVVLNVATAKGTVGNMFYGLAIGFTVLAMAYALGSFSGGAFNPAVATGFFMMHLGSVSDWWIYLAGCFGGAGGAALVFRINNPEDK